MWLHAVTKKNFIVSVKRYNFECCYVSSDVGRKRKSIAEYLKNTQEMIMLIRLHFNYGQNKIF